MLLNEYSDTVLEFSRNEALHFHWTYWNIHWIKKHRHGMGLKQRRNVCGWKIYKPDTQLDDAEGTDL